MRALNYLVIKNNKVWAERPMKTIRDVGWAMFGEGEDGVYLPAGGKQEMTHFLGMVSTEQGVSRVYTEPRAAGQGGRGKALVRMS